MLKITLILISINISCLFSQTILIDKLTRNDTLKIVCEIDGCEIHSKETISIYKCSDTLFTDLKTEYVDYLKHITLSNIISNASIIAYAEFEDKIRKYPNNIRGCTSTAKYKISLKSDNFELEDRGCKFQEYEILKIKLFGQDFINSYNEKIDR
jgi:hypothetical protein